MKVVGITGAGGVGKTTLTVNIASCLVLSEVRTLVIDADLYFPDMSSHVRIPSPRFLHDYLEDPEMDLEWLIQQYPGIRDLYFILGELKVGEVSARDFSLVSGLVEILKEYYGVVIVDFPSGAPIEAAPLLSHLDFQVLVVDLRRIPLVDLETSIVNTLYKYWKGEPKKLALILNFADIPEKRLERLEDYLSSELGIHILGKVSYSNALFTEPYEGVPACLVEEVQDIERITYNLLEYYL